MIGALNMLFVEFNMDDALSVRFEEGVEQGIGIGVEQGIGIGADQKQAQLHQKFMELAQQGYSLKEIEDKLFEQ
jgi:hypothetical protein